jgi:methanogenic corrinoid protein MtbC1
MWVITRCSVMHPFLTEFVTVLETEDKTKCVDLALGQLATGAIDVVTLYQEVLAPALKGMSFSAQEASIKVWHEHVRSSIVRTIIEASYPYVIRQRRAEGKGKAVVVCPSEEYHELGARMVADFFTILGFEVSFVGANTPLDDVVAGIRHEKPKYVAISVSNFYNLVAARRVIEAINGLRKDKTGKFKILVGGGAFQKNPNLALEMGADSLLDTFEDLERYLTGGGK